MKSAVRRLWRSRWVWLVAAVWALAWTGYDSYQHEWLALFDAFCAVVFIAAIHRPEVT